MNSPKKLKDYCSVSIDLEDIFNFAANCSKKLDIKEAIKSVEQRILSTVPELAKQTAIKSFTYRKDQIIETLMLDLTIDECQI